MKKKLPEFPIGLTRKCPSAPVSSSISESVVLRAPDFSTLQEARFPRSKRPRARFTTPIPDFDDADAAIGDLNMHKSSLFPMRESYMVFLRI